MDEKPRLVIIGSGWAGFYLAEKIDLKAYSVTIISPRRTSAYTPLLASAAVGLFNFYLAEEPIRSKARRGLKFYKATVQDIDFQSKSCRCAPAFAGDTKLESKTFEVEYDYLVIAPGCASNTFDTPGVEQHALFMKNVSDAMRFRKQLFDLFEKASLPNVTTKQAKDLLHIAIVGGGPTGVELTAELDDLLHKELRELYPDIVDYSTISIYDIAPSILGAYDSKLHEYATEQLRKRDINVAPNTEIEKVTKSALYIKGTGRVPYGLLVWATGNKQVDLVDALSAQVRLPEKGLPRILTDSHCRVYRSGNSDELWDGVFAIGDAADIDGKSLPTTAEVACQKARYLLVGFNGHRASMAGKPFQYKQKALISYIGRRDGVVAGNEENDSTWTGQGAWLSWRGSTLQWNRNWHSRIMIVLTWILNFVFGVGIAKM